MALSLDLRNALPLTLPNELVPRLDQEERRSVTGMGKSRSKLERLQRRVFFPRMLKAFVAVATVLMASVLSAQTRLYSSVLSCFLLSEFCSKG